MAGLMANLPWHGLLMTLVHKQKTKQMGSLTHFMDGHSSHYTPKLLCFALNKNILILGYPPHCIHALQGLDVVCFAHMKLAWTEEVEKFEAKNSHSVKQK
jgi:hypothetical protein